MPILFFPLSLGLEWNGRSYHSGPFGWWGIRTGNGFESIAISVEHGCIFTLPCFEGTGSERNPSELSWFQGSTCVRQPARPKSSQEISLPPVLHPPSVRWSYPPAASTVVTVHQASKRERTRLREWSARTRSQQLEKGPRQCHRQISSGHAEQLVQSFSHSSNSRYLVVGSDQDRP